MRFQSGRPDFKAAIRESFARQGAMSAVGAEIIALGLCRVRLPFREAVTSSVASFTVAASP